MDTVSELLIDDDGPIRRITFNRPEVHNAQNRTMLKALDDALDDIARDQSVRVLVLAGAGSSFCSGHDLNSIRQDPEYAANAATAEGRYHQESQLFSGPVAKFRTLPIPTVAKVQGYCLAAGLMFVASADLVIAGTSARFGSPVLATQGVNDAEVPSFAWRVGERRAKQALWLNERFDAHDALKMGLVNWVDEDEHLEERTTEVCRRLLEIPPEALSISKTSFQFMSDRLGEREFSQFHFISHQFSHQTQEAAQLLKQRLVPRAVEHNT
jgi:enoyl-CoA hydratase